MDIIRRVLEDYFKYDVLFVQNVTDIDDKVRRKDDERNQLLEGF